MNSVDRVRSILKERGIAVSKMEKDLGFANGYISQLKRGCFPADRLEKIAKYLSLSTSYLLHGEDEPEQNLVELSDEEKQLLIRLKNLPPKSYDSMLTFLSFVENESKKEEQQ